MINLLRAEFLKMMKNLTVFLFTVGTLPVMAFLLLNLLAIAGATGINLIELERVNWHEQIILTLLFSNQIFVQALFIILTAVSFGGESRWQTWKNIIPRRRRSQIVISKYVVLAIVIFFVTQMTALLTFIGSWEITLFMKIPFTGERWDSSGLNFVEQYLWASLALYLNLMLAVIYTGIISVRASSISAGIVGGVLLTLADTVIQTALTFFSRLFNTDMIHFLAILFPNSNIQNIIAYITTGNTLYGMSEYISLIAMLIWIIAGCIMTIHFLESRDIH